MAKKFKKRTIKNNIVEKTEEDIKQEEVAKTGLTKFIFENKRLALGLMALIIALTSFTLYYNTLDYDLVYCDDNIFVHDYKEFNKDIGNIWQSFNRTFGTSYYRPVLGMSFVFDAWIGQMVFEKNGHLQPWAYQLTNNLLHMLGSILVFIFLIKMKYNPISSFMFSMIFAVHPILTPAASWISGRNDSLITFFVLLSFISCLEYYRINAKENMGLKAGLYFIHIILFAASFFTKEIAVFFSILIVVYNLTAREGMWKKVAGKYKLNVKKFFATENLLLGLGWFLIFLYWYWQRDQAFTKITNNPDNFGFDAFITNLPTIPAMFGKIFFPIRMIALSTFEAFDILTGILCVSALIILGFTNKGVRKRHFIFGLSWFILFLIPTLFVRIYLVDDFFDYAEHRAYLILSGVLIMVLELLRGYKINYNNRATQITLLVVFLLFLYKSSNYKMEFDGRKNFWSHMTEMYPYKSRGYLDLGKAYLANRQLAEADSLYQLGIKRNPNNVNFYIDLAVVEAKRGKWKKSLKYAQKAIKMKPNDLLTNINMGRALFHTNNFKKAEKYLVRAAKMDRNKPKNLEIIHKAAVSLHNNQKFDEAEQYYKYFLNFNQKDHQVFRNYGVLLGQKNNPNAEKFLLKALEINPKDPANYNATIKYLLDRGQKGKAKAIVQKAKENKIKLNPNLVKAVTS